MNTATVLPPQTTEVACQEWHIVPDPVILNYYTLETKTGDAVCNLIFPGNDTANHTKFLNLIAAAPELQDIAEMYRDSMTGNTPEKTMIYTIVCNVLSRLQ